jgi:hypothetical protein
MTATGERLRNLTGDHFDTLRVGPRMASVASARSRESEEACRKVYTIHRDGSGLRRLTNGCQTSVAWSPDARRSHACRKVRNGPPTLSLTRHRCCAPVHLRDDAHAAGRYLFDMYGLHRRLSMQHRPPRSSDSRSGQALSLALRRRPKATTWPGRLALSQVKHARGQPDMHSRTPGTAGRQRCPSWCAGLRRLPLLLVTPAPSAG